MLPFTPERTTRTRRPALRWLLVAAAFVAVLVPRAAESQVLYGTLTGNVTDPSGASASGAKVTVTNVGTGIVKTATTDDRGAFSLSDLLPGTYDVVVEATSFQPFTQRGIVLTSNTVRRVDAQLSVSGVSETLEVVAAPPLLQTDRADVHFVQTARQVNDLPLAGTAGRNYQSLMQVVPGAVLQGEQNSAAGSPQRSISFNVNGVSRLQNNTKLDGASIQYPWLPTNTAYVPSSEAIQEVSIVTNSYNAEQGLAGGAAINVVIKSGTNDFHGTAWGYNNDSSRRARNFFSTSPTVPDDTLNQFGANVGGPIVKNRLFFFANWERTKRTNSSPTRTYSLAPADLRAGDFSATGVTIYDPASNPDPALRTPFPGNRIPSSRIDPAAVELMNRMPDPTRPGYVDNYVAQGEGVYKRDNIDAKLNFQASPRMSLFARYSYSPSDIIDPSSLGEAGGDALNGGQVGTAPGKTHVAGIGGTYTFGPNVLLDANVGYTHQKLGAENVDIDSNFGLDVLRIPGTNGPDRLQGGIPSFQINNWANLGNPNTGNPFQFDDKQYVASVNLQWMKSSHAFRFGYDHQNQQLNHFQPQGGTFQTARGTFQFNGNSTRLQNGPVPADLRYNSFADFLLGLPSGAGKVEQLRIPNAIRMKAHAVYAQDTWQATRDLTVNYGVRWEFYPWPTRDVGGVSRFDPADGNVYTGGVGDVPIDTGASAGSGQFLPRLGLAYRLGDKTVVRAGYGHSADPKPYIDFRNAFPINFAWSHPQVQFNGVTNAFLPVTTLRAGLDEARFGRKPDLSQGVVPLPPGAGTTTFPKEDLRKYVQSWNLMFQRELADGFTAQVGYVGTRVQGQQGFVNINASAPGTGNAGRPLARFGIVNDINMISPAGDANYHALQTELKGSMTHAQVGVVYTLSRAKNYQDNDGNPRIQWRGDAAAFELNYGLASFDRTHNLQTYWVWDLPFGKGRRFAEGGIGSLLFGGWQVNGLLSVMSGQPINIIQGNAGNLNAGGSGQYPDRVKDDVEVLGGIGVGNRWFDTTAFAPVNIPAGQPQRFGNAGRNPIRGPGLWNVDMGLFRTFGLTQDLKLQLRVEALNVFNHPNFANPGGDISNAGAFGVITQTTSASGVNGTGERQVRLGARVSF
jgi:outer membrane receptor protein involved in Fe transport